MRFFDVFKLLLPRSRMWQLNSESNLKKFAKGSAVLSEDLRTDGEKSYLDLFPEFTRKIEEWEKEFSVQFTSQLTEEQRRNILTALWKMRYGASTTDFIQEMLRILIPNITVAENNPVRNPVVANVSYIAVNANKNMCCGNKKALCSYRYGSGEFTPGVLKNGTETLYDIPENSRYWETCFFICQSVVYSRSGEIVYVYPISIDRKWKEFIEYIVLSVKPVHTTALMFINWLD